MKNPFLAQVPGLHHPVVRGAAGALALAETNRSESKETNP